jgi:glycosyltransferase involved in cell wall biosynthesis
LKLDLVVPRYGSQIRGGAENAARALATRLVAESGWKVEILTTTASDSTIWSEELPAGTTLEEGVVVHRHPVGAGRHRDFDAYSGPLLTYADQASGEQARRWLEMQGPVSPSLLDAVAASQADAVAFYPYLYHPTAAGLSRSTRPTILHAAAHDEAPIRLPVFRGVFEEADGLVFHTGTERRLVNHLFSVGGRPQIVLGLGVEASPPEGALTDVAQGRPYLLCLGRVDDQKGVGALWRFFLAYKGRRPGPLALVLAGPIIDPPPSHPDIVVTGAVSEAVKWGLLRRAEALVSPSPLESFSLVMAEAWSVGRPVIVNARCEATMEGVHLSGAGLHFGGYAEFETDLDRLSAQPELAGELGRRGRAYVSAHLAWPVVLGRYRDFVHGVLSHWSAEPGSGPARTG